MKQEENKEELKRKLHKKNKELKRAILKWRIKLFLLKTFYYTYFTLKHIIRLLFYPNRVSNINYLFMNIAHTVNMICMGIVIYGMFTHTFRPYVLLVQLVNVMFILINFLIAIRKDRVT